MVHRSNLWAGYLAAMLIIAMSGSAAAEWVAVADYDATTANVVDVSATTTGTGQEIGLADFTTLVAAAHASGNGGVIDFDTHTGEEADTFQSVPETSVGGTDTKKIAFHTLFDSSNKSITIGGGNNDFVGTGFSGSNRTAISGNYMLGNYVLSGGADLEFGAIVGGQVNEYVTTCGLTLLSRGQTGSADYSVTAYFSDSTSTSKQTTLAGSQATDDTFFGFVAPPGSYITAIQVRKETTGTYFTAIDDLGFVTTVVVPEPANVVSLLVAVLCGAAICWRRK